MGPPGNGESAESVPSANPWGRIMVWLATAKELRRPFHCICEVKFGLVDGFGRLQVPILDTEFLTLGIGNVGVTQAIKPCWVRFLSPSIRQDVP